MAIRKRILKTHPAILVLASFLVLIVIGALLLKLPLANRNGSIPFIDALFTAASAVCVTGLTVVDTESSFTLFGQVVILGLIQIGGLGVMTISVALFKWLGRSIPFRHRLVMQDLFAHTPRQDIFSLIKSIFLFTMSAELAGALLLTIHWSRELPIHRAFYLGLFHSISAFCNAGFALFSDSMIRYSDDLLLNATLCSLIVAGGLGFPVLYDLRSWLQRRSSERSRLSIQTKTVLITTSALIAGGAVMFAFLERHSLAAATPAHQVLTALFQSITCRTAGFNTIDIGSLQEATLAMMIFLMFIGASPGSCGGGIKTTTLALLAMFTLSRMKRKRRVNIFKKSVPAETVTRSISLILISITFISAILFMLLIGGSSSEAVARGKSLFLPYCFETVSAFATVGLSTGITPELTLWGKSWIILTMIIGRVGVLAFSYIIVGAGATNGIEYSEENLMIG